MKKCILIHGVDVSGCEFHSNLTIDCNLMPLQNLACENCPNCYYKQFQREKDKNAATENANQQAMRALTTYGNLNEKYYAALKQIHDETIESNIKEIARIAIYTGSKGGKQ